MDRHDRKLLNKQFQWLEPAPQAASSMMLAIVAVFFVGLTIGMFFPHASP